MANFVISDSAINIALSIIISFFSYARTSHVVSKHVRGKLVVLWHFSGCQQWTPGLFQKRCDWIQLTAVKHSLVDK